MLKAKSFNSPEEVLLAIRSLKPGACISYYKRSVISRKPRPREIDMIFAEAHTRYVGGYLICFQRRVRTHGQTSDQIEYLAVGISKETNKRLRNVELLLGAELAAKQGG